jgi:hypothetical protein
MHGDIPPIPITPSCCGAQLKHRDEFLHFCYLLLYNVSQKISSGAANSMIAFPIRKSDLYKM